VHEQLLDRRLGGLPVERLDTSRPSPGDADCEVRLHVTVVYDTPRGLLEYCRA
jgi:hypothetical protein